jgi:opacity protein-like surface antigen
MHRLVAALSLVVGLPSALAAQACEPPKDSHEAKTFAILAVSSVFSPLDAPRLTAPGSVRIGLEGSYIPRIDAATRTPTFCRPGKGPDNTGLLFALPRPRVAIGLPGGLLLEGSWVPPVRVNGVKPNLASVSLARGFALGQIATLGLRAHGTFGHVDGPFTCDDAELQDAASECFQGTRSNDRYKPTSVGVEGSVGWALSGGRFHPYLGGGVNLLRPRFQVNFVNRFGFLDNTQVAVNVTRGVVFGGATWMLGPGLGLSGEIYAAPADAVTGRLELSYGVR